MPGPLTVILPRSFYFDKTSEAVSRLRVVFMQQAVSPAAPEQGSPDWLCFSCVAALCQWWRCGREGATCVRSAG